MKGKIVREFNGHRHVIAYVNASGALIATGGGATTKDSTLDLLFRLDTLLTNASQKIAELELANIELREKSAEHAYVTDKS